MVKTVVGEETQLKLAEDRLSQSVVSAQVGLVIGKLNSTLDRGFVFDLVPTPPNDAGESACSVIESVRDDKRKGSKGKSQADSSSLVIDRDWVVEHARQVSRMLLGGMKVVGIYIWVNDSSFKNSTILLCQTVKGVAEAAPLSEIDFDERVLIHICPSPRRWTCRNCMVTLNVTSSSLRPCDFKMGKVLNSLQKFRCMYNFDLRLPICLEGVSNVRTVTDLLRSAISVHARELKGAKAIVDGNLVVGDEPCTSDELHEVELLLPFMNDATAEACSQKEIVGVLVFKGFVCSFAYLNSKESISQALADIKGDIITSLQSRLDIICDEADGDLGQTIDGGREVSDEIATGKLVPQLALHLLRKQCNLSFPRRVFVPWLANTFICDYLQSSETLEVVKDHIVELMSMEAPTDGTTILEPEIEASIVMASKSFWDVGNSICAASTTPSSKTDDINTRRKESTRKSLISANLNIITAVFFLLLSISVLLIFKNHS